MLLVAYLEPTAVECLCRCVAAKVEEPSSSLVLWAPDLWGASLVHRRRHSRLLCSDPREVPLAAPWAGSAATGLDPGSEGRTILTAGRSCYVNYELADWHGRMILDHFGSSDYVIATPGFDIFVEQMDGQNPDLEGFRAPPPPRGTSPCGVPGARERVYDFDALEDADIKSLVAEGKERGAMDRAATGPRSGRA